MPRRKPLQQPDLLDWTPPETTVAFDPAALRASTLQQRLARAVSLALRDCDDDRAEVARRMGEFLGERVPEAMLNGYAAPSRPDHTISLPRFIALLHVTGDRRLLEMLAEPHEWAVIERRHLPMIELAAVQDKRDELTRQAEALRRQARRGGAM